MGSYALLIGISHFDDPKLAKLDSPKGDVETLANVLKSPDRGAFDSVTLSIDKDPLTIRDQLSTLFDGRGSEDMVLLYYSGHGIVAKGQRLYLATGQSSFDRPQARSIATSEIRDMMEHTRAGRLVVILDCCHSGVFAEGTKGAAAPALSDSTFGAAEGAEGQYILTATDALQYAFDGDGKLRQGEGQSLSRFTQWLVDGIGKGEAAPYEDRITLDSVYQYLCKRAKAEQAGMTPQRFVKRGSGELVIAKNPAPKSMALPSELIAQLDSSEWKKRKAAVEELAAVARQPRMGPLAKKAVLDRISDERDVDVREAMVALLQRLGEPAPEKDGEEERKPEPEPPKSTRKPRENVVPDPPPPPPPPPPILPGDLPNVDEWQTRVLVKSGVGTQALIGPLGPFLLLELQRRANALRTATYMFRTYIASIIVMDLISLGAAESGDVDTALAWGMILIGFGIAGLLNRKQMGLPANLARHPEAMRMMEAVPIVQSRWGWGFGWSLREYEARLYHRTAMWMTIGGAISFLIGAVNN